ncbi:MAG: hypothetical protein MZV64_05205 [Ignavibacteriales bacterium]|nr:hypothetical protein [Ignavibacteriales bacterium]
MSPLPEPHSWTPIPTGLINATPAGASVSLYGRWHGHPAGRRQWRFNHRYHGRKHHSR